jgi:hypothetical protein
MTTIGDLAAVRQPNDWTEEGLPDAETDHWNQFRRLLSPVRARTNCENTPKAQLCKQSDKPTIQALSIGAKTMCPDAMVSKQLASWDKVRTPRTSRSQQI